MSVRSTPTPITGGGPKVDPKTRKPTSLKGSADALRFLQTGLAGLSGQFRSGDIEGTLRDLTERHGSWQATPLAVRTAAGA